MKWKDLNPIVRVESITITDDIRTCTLQFDISTKKCTAKQMLAVMEEYFCGICKEDCDIKPFVMCMPIADKL